MIFPGIAWIVAKSRLKSFISNEMWRHHVESWWSPCWTVWEQEFTKSPNNCQEICITIRETCHSDWNVAVSCICNDGKCWKGFQYVSLIPDIFWLWGIDSALPLLHFSLSWALLPSSWEMDLPLGPDPISNDISKNLPIYFNRSWIGSLHLVLLCIREKENMMTAFYS